MKRLLYQLSIADSTYNTEYDGKMYTQCVFCDYSDERPFHDRGVLRFKENRIVSDLLDFASNHGFGLNEIACRDYSREDRQQLAQLIGCSLRGYGELRSYVDDDAYGAAQLMASGLNEVEARTEHLQSTLNTLRASLVKPMAELFGVHPDDLSANLP